jgi:hypothetical protein
MYIIFTVKQRKRLLFAGVSLINWTEIMNSLIMTTLQKCIRIGQFSVIYIGGGGGAA